MGFKRYILLVFGLFIQTLKLTSQQANISVTLKNKKGEVLSYASYKSLFKNKINDTDSSGLVNCILDINDSLEFSHIGYFSKSYPVKDLLKLKEVVLSEKIQLLEEVKIKKGIDIFLSKTKAKQSRSYSGEDSSERYEMVKLIKVPSQIKSYRIKNVFIKQKHFDITKPIRLHIYSVNSESNMPKDELLNKQIIINKDMYEKDYIIADLKSQNIIIDNCSFFVGVQWLSHSNPKVKNGIDYGIAETTSISDTLTYRRGKLFNNLWFVEFEHGIYVPMQNTVSSKSYQFNLNKKSNPINMIAYAEIEILE